MQPDWAQSQIVQLAAEHLAGHRPAWIWHEDGAHLLWENQAARAFRKKYARKNKDTVTPIGRQIARTIRLGTIGRASLSRLQFKIGKKPISQTCNCTPVELPDGEIGLLIVGAAEVDAEDRRKISPTEATLSGLVHDDAPYAIIDADQNFVSGSKNAQHIFEDFIREDSNENTFAWAISTLKTDNEDLHVLFFSPKENEDLAVSSAPTLETETQVPPSSKSDTPESRDAEPSENTEKSVSLVDRLAQHSDLYAPLTDDDDAFVLEQTPAVEEIEATLLPESFDEKDEQPDTPEIESIDTVVDDDKNGDDAPAHSDMEPSSEKPLWRIIGQGFAANEDEVDDTASLPVETENNTDDDAAQNESNDVAESNTRYNFDELSRILTDRINGERDTNARPIGDNTASAGEVVNLSDENLILNRLSLGLLVFRDQQILFANRALTQLIRYKDTADLREAGLSAIFPDNDGSDTGVGALSYLLGPNDEQIPVSARLQSITWQGKPALLLSATPSEMPTASEAVARNFAEMLATAQNDGFFETNRAGVITNTSGRTAELFGRAEQVLVGRPVLGLVALNESAKLRAFLEEPARFAGDERPFVRLAGAQDGLEILIFAEGMAGIVKGYFGLVHRSHKTDAKSKRTDRLSDPALLERIGRGIRRPLNTIIGFSELIQSGAFGVIENDKYREYTQDINASGHEISGLVDELEQYSRLTGNEYEPNAAVFDLGLLLDKVVARIRRHASNKRVLVRSAISNDLPHISADSATLEQAFLNLLASAIEQTPEGAKVILSAHQVEDGSVEIHVRDSSMADIEGLEDRFVVFRDGTNNSGENLRPVKSTVGLALTRTLLAVNACSLTVDPTSGVGSLMSLVIPTDLVVKPIV